MILQLGHEVFPKAGRVFIINIHLDYVHSINSEEVTAWPFPYSQGIADLIKRRHWALKELYNEEGTATIHRIA